ncbi:hypothetical protein THAOC_28776 [Thalassiosira oceanica]|uniref:Uncharacterized protein n=1 Tax=Thalassiosira oceanica TaxID=159749 RepID=K0RE39_THAOC|nr:hypothetical protein THAOC_28776 [Thalassiosira oceanica]|eukprot:EJK51998.1 hypothetical protein THAOC_28776 [Thalassiosira oceanica]
MRGLFGIGYSSRLVQIVDLSVRQSKWASNSFLPLGSKVFVLYLFLHPKTIVTRERYLQQKGISARLVKDSNVTRLIFFLQVEVHQTVGKVKLFRGSHKT